MSLIEINKNPSRRDLLWFGALFLAFCGIVGGVLVWRFDGMRAARVVWIVGVVVPALYYAIPPLRRPVYLGWLYAALPIGWVVSHVVVLVAFYLVVTPIGLIMRATGRDPMRRSFDPAAETYWTPHKESGGVFKQY